VRSAYSLSAVVVSWVVSVALQTAKVFTH